MPKAKAFFLREKARAFEYSFSGIDSNAAPGEGNSAGHSGSRSAVVGQQMQVRAL
jgi:hypothetical protein